jgi:hypothetical protein
VNTRNLFYVRYLQLKTLDVRNKELFALFVFEKELFRYYPKTEEKILSKIKLKWLFEEISKKNRNNFILRNFNDLEIVYKNIKNLLVIFDKIIDKKPNHTLISEFKQFNKVFNKFIKEIDPNFSTSYIFQIIYMIYDNELVITNSAYEVLINDFNKNCSNIKRVERVFISLFLEIYPKKKKITKKRYLYYILKSYF